MLLAEWGSDADFKPSGLVKQSRRVTILADQSLNLDYEDNDDVERLARRRSRLLDPHTEAVTTPAHDAALRAAASHFMPRAQVGEHYGNCIRLAAENKITYKNAFDLHLIDFMGEMIMKEDASSFRMASSSLDASAKIYAGRVDAVHQETYKVLTGLGRSDNKKIESAEGNGDAGPGEDGNDSADEVGERGNAAEKRKRERKRAVANAKPVIATVLSKIRTKVRPSDADVDPLFQQQAAAYDDGGTVELRLNRLRTRAKFSELLQDSSTPLFQPRSEISALTCSIRPFALPPSIDSCALEAPLCMAFDDFHFNKGDNGDQPDLAPSSPVFVPDDDEGLIAPAPSRSPLSSPMNAGHGDCGDDDEILPLPLSSEIDEAETRTMVVVVEEETKTTLRFAGENAVSNEDNVCNGGKMTEAGEGEVFVNSLKSMLTAHLENFGQVNDGILGLWAGPEHWRKKAKRRRLDEFGNVAVGDAAAAAANATEIGKSARSRVAKAKLLKCDYSLALPDAGENRSKSGCLIRGDWSTELAIYTIKSGKSPVLREQNRRMASDRFNLLAPSITDARQQTYELCNRDVLRSITDNRRVAAVIGDGANDDLANGTIPQPWLDTQTGDCGAAADADGHNEVGSMGPRDDDDDDYAYGGFDGIFTQGNEDVVTPLQVHPDDANAFRGDVELVAPPPQITRLEVHYARSAKLINVRHLKSVLWTIIETSLSHNSPPQKKKSKLEGGVEDHHDEDGHKQPVASSFSKLLTTLPQNVSKQTAGDLSVAIGLNCLLHLANEKDLFLETSEDFTDLAISQGPSATELSLVAEYQGRAATAATRHPKKQVSLDRWVEAVQVDDD